MTLINEFVNLTGNQSGFVIVLKIDQMTLLSNDELSKSTQILQLTLLRFLSKLSTQLSRLFYLFTFKKKFNLRNITYYEAINFIINVDTI